MLNLEMAKDRANQRRCGVCNGLDTVVIIHLENGGFMYICLTCAGLALNKLVQKEGEKKLDELL